MRLALSHLHDYTSYLASGLLIYLDRDFPSIRGYLY